MRLFQIGLFLITAFSAQTQSTDQQKTEEINLKGTWVGCDKYNGYMEWHYSDYLSYSARERYMDLSIIIVPYSVLEDSIFYYNYTYQEHLPDYFEMVGPRQVIMISNDESYHLRKISDQSLFPFPEDFDIQAPIDSIMTKHYQYMFNKRKENFVCPNSK